MRCEIRFLVNGVGQKPKVGWKTWRDCQSVAEALRYAAVQCERSQPQTVDLLVRVEVRIAAEEAVAMDGPSVGAER
jgi:hypothetical protein